MNPPPIPSTPPTGHYWQQFIEANQAIAQELRAENVREREARKEHLGIMWELGKKVDSVALDMAGIKGAVMQCDARLTILERRTDKLEGKADMLSETTGQFKVDALQAQLATTKEQVAETKESRRHWIRTAAGWVVAALVTAGTIAAGIVERSCG